jgi:hypothetical protein
MTTETKVLRYGNGCIGPDGKKYDCFHCPFKDCKADSGGGAKYKFSISHSEKGMRVVV